MILKYSAGLAADLQQTCVRVYHRLQSSNLKRGQSQRQAKLEYELVSSLLVHTNAWQQVLYIAVEVGVVGGFRVRNAVRFSLILVFCGSRPHNVTRV